MRSLAPARSLSSLRTLLSPLVSSLSGIRRVVRCFWPRIRKQRRLMTGSFLALFAEIGLRLLEPWPLKLLFDYVFAARYAASPATLPFAGSPDTLHVLTFCALAVVVITGLRALAEYGSAVGFALIGHRVLTEVREEVYRHLQRLSLAFHTQARTGDLTVRVISDVGLLRDAVSTALLPLAGNVLVLLGMLAVMFWLQWQLALLALATFPLFGLTAARLGQRIQAVARKQRQREGAMAATAAESMGAIKLIQSLSLESKFARTFSSQSAKSLKEGAKASRLAASLERAVDALIAVATALVLWYGAQLVLRDVLTAGDLLVFLTYLKNAFKPMRDLAKYTGRLAKATAAGERVLDLLDRKPAVRDLQAAVPARELHGAVRFDGVGFDYEPGQRGLRDIDFEVEPGQHVAVVGPSGSGKSTLVSLILRLYDPTAGRILIDGRDIRGYTLESLRGQINLLLQDSLLFAESVRDNIACGTADATAEAVEAAARLANAHEFIAAMPRGYDTVLGERGVTLSNGQRQRIAIARAALRRAAILILDEPTTGLDEENEHVVIQALERLSRGRTTFLITHNLALAAHADLVLYLEAGRLLERGAHAELMRTDGRYAALYRLQTAAPYRGVHEDALAFSR